MQNKLLVSIAKLKRYQRGGSKLNIKEAAEIAMKEGKCIFMKAIPAVKIRLEKTDMCTLMLRDGSYPKTGWQPTGEQLVSEDWDVTE